MAIKSTAAVFDYTSQISETGPNVITTAGEWVFELNGTGLFCYRTNSFGHMIERYSFPTAFTISTQSGDAVKIGNYYYISAGREVAGVVHEIRRFDPKTGTLSSIAMPSAFDYTRYSAWSPNGKYLAIFCAQYLVILKFNPVTETFTNLNYVDANIQRARWIVWSKQSDYIVAYDRQFNRSRFRAVHLDNATDVITTIPPADIIQEATLTFADFQFSPDGQYYVVTFESTTSGSQFQIYKKTGTLSFAKQTLTGTTDLPSLTSIPWFCSWDLDAVISFVSVRNQAYTATFDRGTNGLAFIRSITTRLANADISWHSKHKIPFKKGMAWKALLITTATNTFTHIIGITDTTNPRISVPNLTHTNNRTAAASNAPTDSMRYASQDGKVVCMFVASGNYSIKIRNASGAYVDSAIVFNATNNCYPTVSPDGKLLIVKNNASTGLALYTFDDALNDFVLTNENWILFTGMSAATNLTFVWSFSGKKLGIFSAASFWKVLRVNADNPTWAREFTARAYLFKFYNEDFFYKESASSGTTYVGTHNPITDEYTVSNFSTQTSIGLAITGRFVFSWLNNGTITAHAKTALSSYSGAVTDLATTLGIPNATMNSYASFVSPNGRYLVMHNSSNAYRIWDTTTFPFTEVTDGTAIATETGNNTFPFITNDGELLIAGLKGFVRESGDVAYTTYPKYGMIIETSSPPTLIANLNYPKFGVTGSTNELIKTNGALNYPVFGMAASAKIPLIIQGSMTYPTYGMASTAIQTEYEPVVSYDLGFSSVPILVETYVNDLIFEETQVVDIAMNYPVFGVESLAGLPVEITASSFAYPMFGLASEMTVPQAGLVVSSYPVYGLQSTIIQTEYEPIVSYDLAMVAPSITVDSKSTAASITAGGQYGYAVYTYPTFGYAGQIVSPEEFTVDMTYPTFGMEAWAGSPESFDVIAEYPIFGMAISTARMFAGEMVFPAFGAEGLVLVEEDISGELVFPIFGTDGDIGSNRIHPMELGYPSYSVSVESETLPTEYSGELVYPVFGMEAEVEEFIGVRSELIFPTFGMDNSARVAEPVYGELGYPALTMDGYAKIPELGDAAYTFAEFEFSGSIRVPETITGELAYPIFSFEGSVRVPETIVGNYTYPVYGTDGYVRVPETIDIDAQYPVYGFEGNVRVPLVINDSNTYPVFSVAGTIIPSYKGNSEIRYPVFRMDGLSGYPDQINSNLMFPIFGLTGILKEEGETIEVTNAYPVFGVTAELQQFYALNLDSLIGVMSVESEATTIKAARRRLIIRR